MKCIFLFLLFFSIRVSAQIDPSKITIARDSFGVPHIFAPTDAEVAYGLAWAEAEDDFNDVQMLLLTGQANLGAVLGKEGARIDYVVKLLRCRKLVEDQWKDLSPDFVTLVKGYVEGLNSYARQHPGEVKLKRAFPCDEKDYLTAVVFSLSVFCGIDQLLPQIFNGKVATIPGFNSQGSNAIAIHPTKTASGEAFLAINAHQPLEGPTAFYEAHVQSEEGWNMLGGVFPGGCLIFHGTNENLGWAHTVNNQDKIDLFQLQMNPSNSNQYQFDNQWVDLESERIKLKVKGVPVAVHRNIHWSKYGATVKTDRGVFSIRLPANMDCKALEEWYRMNKAKNFTEFYRALSMTSIPMFNITYADRNDTIFYISNGKIPVRNPDPKYHWRSTIPGNTSATLWTEFKPITALPQYLNPPSGFLYNTNHSPFLATDLKDNLDPSKFDPNDGYELYYNNRGKRVMELIHPEEKINYETFKRIKFDRQLPEQLQYPYSIDSMLNLNADDYPTLKNVITTFQHWDKRGVADSKGAGIFLLVYHHVARNLAGTPARKLTKQESIDAYQFVYDYMTKNFGKTDLTLGDIQKLVRGNEALPASGLPDVLAAAYTEPYKDGMRKIVQGDAYICFVRYRKEGLPIIESINAFGASNHPESKHYKDQMKMFLKQETKPETLDKNEIMKSAEKIYSPK